MAEVTAGGAVHASREVFDKSLGVVVDIFVPVAAVIGGFFMPTVLGGGPTVVNLVGDTASGGISNMSAYRIGWGFQALINSAVGYAFWHMRHSGGIILKIIGGIVGGFFLGGALGCVPGLIKGSAPPGGLIDTLAAGIQNVAKET